MNDHYAGPINDAPWTPSLSEVRHVYKQASPCQTGQSALKIETVQHKFTTMPHLSSFKHQRHFYVA
jgi:hypothetical protein